MIRWEWAAGLGVLVSWLLALVWAQLFTAMLEDQWRRYAKALNDAYRDMRTAERGAQEPAHLDKRM